MRTPVARMNMLDEFLKQEKMLQEKLAENKEQIDIMNTNYELELKNIEEKYVHSKEM